MADRTITVTVATGTQYIIGGTGNVYFFDGSQPLSNNLDWVTSGTLRLDQSDSSNNNHPLYITSSSSTNLSTGQAAIQTSNISYYLDGAVSQADYYTTILFNAATTKYVEFTQPTTQTYWSCWIHGIGMGGFFDLIYDSWGALDWGQGEWAAQGDESVTLVSPGLITTTLNAAEVLVTVTPGWGTENWGENGWGDVTGATETLTGFGLTTAQGSLTTAVATPVVITSPGVITSAVGDLTLKYDYELTIASAGIITSAQGTLDINNGSDMHVGLESFVATSAVGAIAPSDVVGLTMIDDISGRVGNLINETATLVELSTLTAITSTVGTIEVPDTQVGITAAFSITSAVGAIVPINNTNVLLTGLEMSVILDATELTTTGYRNVDMEVNSNYTDVKHVNQA